MAVELAFSPTPGRRAPQGSEANHGEAHCRQGPEQATCGCRIARGCTGRSVRGVLIINLITDASLFRFETLASSETAAALGLVQTSYEQNFRPEHQI